MASVGTGPHRGGLQVVKNSDRWQPVLGLTLLKNWGGATQRFTQQWKNGAFDQSSSKHLRELWYILRNYTTNALTKLAVSDWAHTSPTSNRHGVDILSYVLVAQLRHDNITRTNLIGIQVRTRMKIWRLFCSYTGWDKPIIICQSTRTDGQTLCLTWSPLYSSTPPSIYP